MVSRDTGTIRPYLLGVNLPSVGRREHNTPVLKVAICRASVVDNTTADAYGAVWVMDREAETFVVPVHADYDLALLLALVVTLPGKKPGEHFVQVRRKAVFVSE